VLQTRNAKTKGSQLCRHQSVVQAADMNHSIHRALAERRCLIPMIAYWSATMRC
jgi:hypothetical protein